MAVVAMAAADMEAADMGEEVVVMGAEAAALEVVTGCRTSELASGTRHLVSDVPEWPSPYG